jgi:hypothetical protein
MAVFTIDTENNIAAHAAVPTITENLQPFATEKELAKLAAESPGWHPPEVFSEPAAELAL